MIVKQHEMNINRVFIFYGKHCDLFFLLTAVVGSQLMGSHTPVGSLCTDEEKPELNPFNVVQSS